jgi:hypothetical protein
MRILAFVSYVFETPFSANDPQVAFFGRAPLFLTPDYSEPMTKMPSGIVKQRATLAEVKSLPTRSHVNSDPLPSSVPGVMSSRAI